MKQYAMKKQWLAFCLALVCGVGPVFGQAKPDDEKVHVRTIESGRLHGVCSHAGFEVTVRQGTRSGATITVDSRLQPYLRVKVSGGVLELGFDDLPRELQRAGLARRADVTVVTLDRAETHSGAHITGSGSFTSGSCHLQAHSGSRIDGIDLRADVVRVETHSGATIVAGGQAESLEVSSSSGSTADLGNLKTNSISAKASSGSSLICRPTGSLNARASSGASIRYRQHALNNSSMNSSSGGSIRPIK